MGCYHGRGRGSRRGSLLAPVVGVGVSWTGHTTSHGGTEPVSAVGSALASVASGACLGATDGGPCREGYPVECRAGCDGQPGHGGHRPRDRRSKARRRPRVPGPTSRTAGGEVMSRHSLLLALVLVASGTALVAAPIPKSGPLPPPTPEQLRASENNLKQIGLAGHNYHDANGVMANNV